MHKIFHLAGTLLLLTMAAAGNPPADTFIVKKCSDFTITGDGTNSEWNKASWNPLTKLDTGGKNYPSRFKIMYSTTGIYLLFDGEDQMITTSYENDFENLFRGDVFEVFFHTNTEVPMYLEYEINALNKELVLLVPNFNNKSYGWIPWHYTDRRQIKKQVSVRGGKAVKNTGISGWTAEIFFPYTIFAPLDKVPPVSNTTWTANFYRLDYDNGKAIKYAWAPIEKSFHEFKKYRLLRFE